MKVVQKFKEAFTHRMKKKEVTEIPHVDVESSDGPIPHLTLMEGHLLHQETVEKRKHKRHNPGKGG